MQSKQVEFMGSMDAKLSARLDLPEGEPRAYALFAHCFTCTKDVYAASRICGELTHHGIAVLRFDFTGLGASEGDFSNTNFTSNIADLLAAAEWLTANYKAPTMLIGHSLGGSAVIVAATKLDSVKLVATIGAPADPAHVASHFTEAHPEIEKNGEAEVLLVGRPFRIRKQFMDDISNHKLEDSITALHRALIVFHAPLDRTVGIENAGKIFAAAKHPKSFIGLDEADHMLSRREDAIYVAEILAAWVTRYLAAQ